MKTLNITAIALLVLLAISAGSCSEEEYNHRALFSDIVTATQNTPQGAEFEFIRYDDSPAVTFTAPGMAVKDELIGKRVLLRYYALPGNGSSTENIEIAALSPINCDTARVAAVDTIAWNATPVYLNSIWRSGKYINLHLRVIYTETARLFNLTVDSATIDDAVPQLYMCHDTFGAPDNYMFETYASYDISKIWNRPTCTGIDIHINDSNLNKDIYSFKKQ
ncbi:MAG: hypothetical protein NC248_09975 [Bacteroides sp.]|nr:hypothetical protein [Bacteroides sp.]MCM1388982.1 hypothetical protein [Bacteroides sp.]